MYENTFLIFNIGYNNRLRIKKKKNLFNQLNAHFADLHLTCRFISYKLFELFSFTIKRSRFLFYFFDAFFPFMNLLYFPTVTIFPDVKNEQNIFLQE